MSTSYVNLSPKTQIICCMLLSCIALAIAMGIGRFAFTPILPLMIQENIVALPQTALLSSANYLGYLVGAMMLLKNRYHRLTIVLGLGIVTVMTFLSAYHDYTWLLIFRFLAGLASAWVLVSVSAWANPWLKRQQVAKSGLIYTGVGIGIAVTGTLCALFILNQWQSNQIWQCIAFIALVFSLIVVILFRFINPQLALPYFSESQNLASTPSNPRQYPNSAQTPLTPVTLPTTLPIWRLLLAYGLFGFGYILPATFLPQIAKQWLSGQDFLYVWPIFGTAAAISVALSLVFKKFSLVRIWLVAQLLMAVGTFLPAVWQSLPSLMLSALLVGGTFMVVTMAGLQLASGMNKSYNLPALMTASFALGQLLGPFITLLGSGQASWQALLPISSLALIIGAVLIWQRKI